MVSLNRRFSSKSTKAPKAATKLAGQAVELEISLRYIRPRIWRRFVVPMGIKLHTLHAVIQAVMGWTDSHLHCFRADNYEYTRPDPDDPGWAETMSDVIVRDERRHTLGDIVCAKGDKFSYTYDFGDDWEHEIKVKSITPSPMPLKFAFCVHGERACPPEDCGSVPGYEELCEALPNSQHPEHGHWKEWIGEYDSSHFDCVAVNRLLEKIRV